MDDSDRLLRLVELAYDASLNPTAWERLLSELANTLNGNAAVIIRHDLVGTGNVMGIAHMDPDAASAYDQHFHKLDPFAAPLKRAGAEARGGVFAGDRLVDRSAFQRSEFGNDFALRFGVGRMITIVTPKDAASPGSGATAITIMRPSQSKAFVETEARLLRRLLPHVTRAMDVSHRLHRAGQAEQMAAHALDLVQTAAFVVDRGGVLLRANAHGESLLRKSCGLRVAGGLLEAYTAADTAALVAACARAAAPDDATSERGTTLAITGPDGGRIRVVAVPVDRLRDEWSGAAERAALLLVEPLDPGPLLRADLLAGLYGLTNAEADVAARMARGDSVEDIAKARRYTIDTARWYGKQVLGKCGCGSRAELVRRLSRGPASLLASDS